MEQLTLIGNLISAVGVCLLLFGHYTISTGKEINGLLLSILGSLIVAVGAVFLTSWPILFLNVFWILIGTYGVIQRKKPWTEKAFKHKPKYINHFFALLFLIGIYFSIVGEQEIAAWLCTALYLLAFASFSNKYINNFQYMLWTFFGFFLLLEHLILKDNYSVLFNESLGAAISFKGMLFCIKKKSINSI